MVSFVHSGYSAEHGGTDAYGAFSDDRIWSHMWAMLPSFLSAEGVRVMNYYLTSALFGVKDSEVVRIGVIAHEAGHFLGLPDLYDVQTKTDSSGVCVCVCVCVCVIVCVCVYVCVCVVCVVCVCVVCVSVSVCARDRRSHAMHTPDSTIQHTPAQTPAFAALYTHRKPGVGEGIGSWGTHGQLVGV